MISKPKRFAGLAAAVLAAGALAACSSSSTSSPAAGSSSSTPVSGGTLHIVAASGPAHLDTVPSYYTTDYQLTHAYTRQLLNYPTLPYTSTSSADWTADTTPTADVATEVPTTANGGITNGGKTYTFHIKPGVDWNTSPPRQVTSQDFLREFKAFFNPVSPVGNPVYYESTIAGLTAYANAETAYFASQVERADRGEHHELPEHAHHLRHHDAELVDDPVHADVAGQRLPVHDGDAVHVGPAGGVRQLRAEQPAARPAHDLRRPVPDQLLHPGQVDHDGQEPGLEAVHGPAPARLRGHRSWTRWG